MAAGMNDRNAKGGSDMTGKQAVNAQRQRKVPCGGDGPLFGPGIR